MSGPSLRSLQVFKELTSPILTRVTKPVRTIHRRNILHILLVQLIYHLQRLKVTLNSPFMDTLRNNRSPPLDPPRDRNMRPLHTMFLRNLLDNLMLYQRVDVLARVVDVVLVAEGGVRGDFYAVLFMEFEERGLLQVRVGFILVHCGDDFSGFEEGLDFFFGEVGDADGFYFACVEEFFHCCPGLGCQRTQNV